MDTNGCPLSDFSKCKVYLRRHFVRVGIHFSRKPSEKQNTSVFQKVAVGSIRRKGGRYYQISTEHIHPNFDETALFNDIAVIELSSEIEMGDSENVSKVRLAPPGSIMNGCK